MKKIIIFILATALLFTACGQQETTAQLEKPTNIEVSSFTNEKTASNEKTQRVYFFHYSGEYAVRKSFVSIKSSRF